MNLAESAQMDGYVNRNQLISGETSPDRNKAKISQAQQDLNNSIKMMSAVNSDAFVNQPHTDDVVPQDTADSRMSANQASTNQGLFTGVRESSKHRKRRLVQATSGSKAVIRQQTNLSNFSPRDILQSPTKRPQVQRMPLNKTKQSTTYLKDERLYA